jgi:phosphoglycolate phosphatase
MAVKAIIFDKDGTLFDFQATWGAWAAGFLARLSEGDTALFGALADAIGYDSETRRFDRHSVAIAGSQGEVADALMPYLSGIVRSDLVARMDHEAVHVPLAPSVALVPYLSGLSARGLALGVVTNDAEIPARAHLQASGVLEAFGVVLGYDSGFGAKPAPGPILEAVRRLGAMPEQAVMVGDSTHDLVAGRAAGLRTVGVLTGPADADDLAPHADVVMPDIGHLPEWLDRH